MKKSAYIVVAVLVSAALAWLVMRMVGPRVRTERRPNGSLSEPAATPPPARAEVIPSTPAPVASVVPGPPSPPDPSRPPFPAPPAVVTTQPGVSGSESVLPAAAPRTVEADLNAMRTVFKDYRAAFKENPVGTNAEITRALTGRNPNKASFLPNSTPRNEKGELIDRWGRPYFFHQISGTLMEIRSGGPDQKMWTNDDAFAK